MVQTPFLKNIEHHFSIDTRVYDHFGQPRYHFLEDRVLFQLMHRVRHDYSRMSWCCFPRIRGYCFGSGTEGHDYSGQPNTISPFSGNASAPAQVGQGAIGAGRII